jgi:hypothetical protein
MAGETERRTERIPLLMTPSEVKALDDWAFANRIRSRGEAIRRLIEAGLGARDFPAPSGSGDPDPTTRSKLGPSRVPRAKKPPPERKAEPEPRSKLEQIRALREQGAR